MKDKKTPNRCTKGPDGLHEAKDGKCIHCGIKVDATVRQLLPIFRGAKIK